ncbi:hypothetical protein CDAR_194011 [Caerostris darwini]|uniref:Uncharacterized protein n=1 Tax=Caerostris darwini TaxID=1538125 RepID=A0AAV4T157_9ARAC|nr:hypothetical protein CDAR_194011 [Caerostris darwini]
MSPDSEECQETDKCLKWHSLIHTIADSSSVYSYELSSLREILTNTYKSCSTQFSTLPSLDEDPGCYIKCKEIDKIQTNSSYCDVDWNHNCCIILCLDSTHHSACSYFTPDSLKNSEPAFDKDNQRLQPRHEDTIREENRNSHGGLRRKKRSSKLNSPFRIEVTENVKEISVLQPFNLTVRLRDKNVSFNHFNH